MKTRFAPVSLLMVVLTAPLAVLAQNTFAVGTASAAPGQKATGFLEVPAGSDAALSIPVVVVNGAKPGPTLALVSGSHGTEYASIIAVEKLIEQVDPAQVSGKVILIPLVNIGSFEGKVPHLNPVDGKSMNRFYPGKPDGTQTERASYAITRQVIERADYVIDYHGGDLDEDLRPYAYWAKTGKAQFDEITHRMVLAFGLDTIILQADRPSDPANSHYADTTAATRGKPAITVEAGHAGTVESDDVQKLAQGTLSVLRELKMLPGAPSPIENPVWIDHLSTVTSEQPGIFYPLVKRGTFAAAGMKIGYVTDYFGKVIYEARAPEAGVILYICAVPSMAKGGTIASIGHVAATPPGIP